MVRASWQFCFLCCCWGLLPLYASNYSRVQAEDPAVQKFMNAGEFGPAIAAAKKLSPADRDAALAAIAAKQASSNARRGSLITLSEIQDQTVRSQTAQWLRNQPLRGAAGGGVIADFDTLIDLVTSTIAPDSWLDNGGKGTISGFPTGVLVNAEGLMTRLKPVSTPTLEKLRETARDRTANRDPRTSSKQRKISLTRLERAVQERYAQGLPLTESMRNLAGVQSIEYLFVYPETQEIVIVGPASDWYINEEGRVVGRENQQPVLQLDDFVETLRNAYESGEFGCAITPTRENLEQTQQYLATTGKKSLPPGKAAREEWVQGLRASLGLQDIEVHGIDSRSHAARVIVEADHHMKLIGMGLEKGVAGVTSYLEALELKPGEAPPNMGVLRWWFTLGDGAIRAASSGDAYEFTGSAVKVLSENEKLNERGERIHTGKSEELNLQFAESFTKHFPALSAKYPVYAELQNVFDWAVVAAILKQKKVMDTVGWQATHFRSTEAYPIAVQAVPRKVQSIANYRLVNGRTLVAGVSGGVEVKANEKLTSTRFKVDDYGDLSAGRAQASPRAELNAWWWD